MSSAFDVRRSCASISRLPGAHDQLVCRLPSQLGITFCFEVITDMAFLPPLMVMWRYRRHFELYVGVFQLATGILYNVCNALNVNLFLTELQWHALNNILTTTYFLLLLIHLQVRVPAVAAHDSSPTQIGITRTCTVGAGEHEPNGRHRPALRSLHRCVDRAGVRPASTNPCQLVVSAAG